MKKDIHPKLNTDTTATCACGNSFVTTSTLQTIKVDICSMCHPQYTGQQKFVDTEGRIDKFNKKLEIAKQKGKKIGSAKNTTKKQARKPSSLKELLAEANKKTNQTKKDIK